MISFTVVPGGALTGCATSVLAPALFAGAKGSNRDGSTETSHLIRFPACGSVPVSAASVDVLRATNNPIAASAVQTPAGIHRLCKIALMATHLAPSSLETGSLKTT